MSSTSIRLRKSLTPGKGFELFLFAEVAGQMYPASTLVFATESAEEALEETTTIAQEAAEQLMTDLWDAGVRPVGRQSPPSVLTAQSLHIEHLHEIALKALDK